MAHQFICLLYARAIMPLAPVDAPGVTMHDARVAFPTPRVVRAPCTLLALGLALSGCAKKGPPSGGPPDLEPPRVVSSVPDSGTARVPLDTRISITFSEGMEPRSTGESVALAPRIDIRRQRWSGRTLALALARPLDPERTYTLFVGGEARDRHGNPLGAGAAIVFSTGDSFPPGLLAGQVEARGFSAPGTYVWCYDAARGREPDSTARDFDALGLADANGAFRVAGLAVPGRYRLWAFADLNGNRSFEPAADILSPLDTTFNLIPDRPRAESLLLSVVNPRAPGRVRGAVLDTLGDSLGVVRVMAVSDSDTTLRKMDEVGDGGGFDFQLDAGRWRLRAFRDHDKNRGWKPADEPASPMLVILVEPADDLTGLTLVLRRPAGLP